MTDLPVLLVAGLGRCGTTMMMTMLDAGGFPVTGPRPSYEDSERFGALRVDRPWLAAQGGRAVKLIDPSRYRLTRADFPVPPVVILMERRHGDQARSQCKMLSASGVGSGLSRRVEKAMQRSIARDTPVLRAQLGKLGGPIHRHQFEDVLADPAMAALLLGRIVASRFGQRFDMGAARDAVIARDPRCAPDFWMEDVVLPEIAKELSARDAA